MSHIGQSVRSEKQFEDVILEHDALIRRICRMYFDCTEDRKDLYQEIVLQLWRSSHQFRGSSRISTWIYRVALNTSITFFRKTRRQIQTSSLDEHRIDLPEPSSGRDINDSRSLYQAISRLSKVERAITLLYLEDIPYEEIGQIMGISASHARVKMFRIRDKLKKMMDGYNQ